ncbi:MAG: dephospho-CoA kinase [Campylobacter sp.]|nr:dephospho-CoA kinase [Campylobacter sp.]
MNKFKKAYVITGSIGCGKSSVCGVLKTLGFAIIDADEISHAELEKSSSQIAKIFGNEILSAGKIDRAKLGKIVFSDRTKLAILEGVLHPKIKAEILRQASNLEKKDRVYFVDIPLYFERENYKEFDKVVVVYAPKDVLISRVMARNSLSYEQAKARVELQIDIQSKKDRANFVIDNSKSLTQLQTQILKFLDTIKAKY